MIYERVDPSERIRLSLSKLPVITGNEAKETTWEDLLADRRDSFAADVSGKSRVPSVTENLMFSFAGPFA